MKKMLFSLSVLLAASCALATVESQVVGYQSTDLSANVFKMMGVQFNNVADGSSVKLNGMFTGTIPYGTQVQFMGSNGAYDTYEYSQEAYDEAQDDVVVGWADTDGYLTNVDFPIASAFWFKTPSGTTLTLAGEVSSENSISANTPVNRFAMISAGYPVDVNLNSLSWSNLTYGDSVQVQAKLGGYDVYEYLEEAFNMDTEEIVTGWADTDGVLVTTPTIPAGSGFWIKTGKAVTVSFETPLNN